jgi:hypothetical protein
MPTPPIPILKTPSGEMQWCSAHNNGEGLWMPIKYFYSYRQRQLCKECNNLRIKLKRWERFPLPEIPSRVKNLSGQTFGDLTVIAYAGLDRTHHSRWLCMCVCGKETTVSCNNLVMDNVRSCGCYKFKTFLPPKEGGRRAAKRHYVKGAKHRNLCWELSDELFHSLLEKNCYYCDSPPSNLFKGAFHKFKYNGIDRIDSDKGYTPDNVVPCCGVCNRMKLDLRREDFLLQIAKINAHSNPKYLLQFNDTAAGWDEPIFSLVYSGGDNARR